MLAGETFSDRPRSVSPTIGGLLRAYNDWVPDDLRQDLYRYAAEVVGTQAPQSVEDERLRRVLEWGEQTRADRRGRLISLPRRRRPDQRGKVTPDEAGTFAVRAIGRPKRQAHEQLLALVDELIAIGQATETIPPVSSERPVAHGLLGLDGVPSRSHRHGAYR